MEPLKIIDLAAALAGIVAFFDLVISQRWRTKRWVAIIEVGTVAILVVVAIVLYVRYQPVSEHQPVVAMPPVDHSKDQTKNPKPVIPRRVPEKLTIAKPQNGATSVPLDPPIEFSYVNVPDHQHLWLIVVGDEPHESDPNLYWPIGYLFGEGHSVVLDGEITHNDPKPNTWRSKFPARNAWFSNAGKRYLLELIAVDDTDDEDLGRAYKEEVERGGPEKKYPGVKKDEHDYESFAKARAKPVHVTRGQ